MSAANCQRNNSSGGQSVALLKTRCENCDRRSSRKPPRRVWQAVVTSLLCGRRSMVARQSRIDWHAEDTLVGAIRMCECIPHDK